MTRECYIGESSTVRQQHLTKEGLMKAIVNVLVLVSLIAVPLTAAAFSRGGDSSEVLQPPAQLHQAHHAGKHDGNTDTQTISPAAVPEPPVLWLLGIGVSLFALVVGIKRVRGLWR
jgi:hypothetical protein